MIRVVRPRISVVERVADQALALGVERAGGLVEDQDARVLEQRARDRHPLLLAAGELHPALAHQRVVALREPGDELVRVGGLGGGEDLLLAGVGPGVADVVGDRVGEEHRLLGDGADLLAQPLRIELAQIASEERHPAGRLVIGDNGWSSKHSPGPGRRGSVGKVGL